MSGVKEEQLCEDFARNIIKEYSGVTNSELMNFIRENFLDGKDIRIKESQVVETKGDVETDFTKPINLAD